MLGKLYLIPTLLDQNGSICYALPQQAQFVVAELKFFIVENEKSARAFLKKIGVKTPQNELTFHTLNKHHREDLNTYLKPILNGENVGVLSEAGCPGIADPGADIVTLAHKNQIQVVPLVGPSSIILSLMASGFNGQNFTFHGYLPIEKKSRLKKIQELERASERLNQTQIFIETPFRNNSLIDDLLKCCHPNTSLSISCDLTASTEFIATKTVALWQKEKPNLNKRPAIFLLHKTRV